MSTGSQGCYGNIWESAYTHTHTHSRCVRVRRFGSAYTCSYALLIRHVVRSQKPWLCTEEGEQGRVYKRRLPCTARRTAAWLPGGTIVEPACLPGSHKANAACSLSLTHSSCLPAGEASASCLKWLPHGFSLSCLCGCCLLCMPDEHYEAWGRDRGAWDASLMRLVVMSAFAMHKGSAALSP